VSVEFVELAIKTARGALTLAYPSRRMMISRDVAESGHEFVPHREPISAR
jgi:hypothetical protein